VAVNDVLEHMLWTCNFLLSQGVEVKDTIIYQDNKSAIIVEHNGELLSSKSSKRTGHINVRYLFIKDCINKMEVAVEHCAHD
jgi:hypothetical protein